MSRQAADKTEAPYKSQQDTHTHMAQVGHPGGSDGAAAAAAGCSTKLVDAALA